MHLKDAPSADEAISLALSGSACWAANILYCDGVLLRRNLGAPRAEKKPQTKRWHSSWRNRSFRICLNSTPPTSCQPDVWYLKHLFAKKARLAFIEVRLGKQETVEDSAREERWISPLADFRGYRKARNLKPPWRRDHSPRQVCFKESALLRKYPNVSVKTLQRTQQQSYEATVSIFFSLGSGLAYVGVKKWKYEFDILRAVAKMYDQQRVYFPSVFPQQRDIRVRENIFFLAGANLFLLTFTQETYGKRGPTRRSEHRLSVSVFSSACK